MNIKTARFINRLFFLGCFGVALGFLINDRFPLAINPTVTAIFYTGVLLLERYTAFKLHNLIRMLLCLTLIAHSLLGEYFRFYYDTVFFDNALHCFGTFSFALAAYNLMTTFIIIQSSHPGLFIFLIVTAMGISLGTIFELLEFILDLILKEKNQFGLIDTDWDLFYDLIGALLAGIIAGLRHRNH